MAKKHKKDGKTKGSAALPVMRPDAAGIDIGATEIYVAVPADRASEHVTRVPDLHARSVRVGRLAQAVRHPDGSDGIHGRVLDSVVSDSGGARI